MKPTEGNSLEVAGVLIAIGFIAAWLTAGGPVAKGYSIPLNWQMSVETDVPAERLQQRIQQPLPQNVLPLPLVIVKGGITARNPNALEAKHAMQRRLETLDSYVSQQGGSVTLGDVRYTRAGKTGEFIAAQQIEIRLPDSPSDSAYEHKLIRLGVRLNSVERIAQISVSK